MGRFRIRWGDREIEYEGTDSTAKYESALNLLSRAQKSDSSQPDKREDNQATSPRGGSRKGIFAPEIKRLVQEGFFKLPHKKRIDEVLKALEDRGLPVKGKKDEVTNACRRMLRTLLKGTKDSDGWVFWQD